jgi:hypothetical protein
VAVKVFPNIEEFAGAAGADPGTSDWAEIDQDRIRYTAP